MEEKNYDRHEKEGKKSNFMITKTEKETKKKNDKS